MTKKEYFLSALISMAAAFLVSLVPMGIMMMSKAPELLIGNVAGVVQLFVLYHTFQFMKSLTYVRDGYQNVTSIQA